MALYLQKTNHARARMRSRRFSAPAPRRCCDWPRLADFTGERDRTAFPHLAERAGPA